MCSLCSFFSLFIFKFLNLRIFFQNICFFSLSRCWHSLSFSFLISPLQTCLVINLKTHFSLSLKSRPFFWAVMSKLHNTRFKFPPLRIVSFVGNRPSTFSNMAAFFILSQLGRGEKNDENYSHSHREREFFLVETVCLS